MSTMFFEKGRSEMRIENSETVDKTAHGPQVPIVKRTWVSG